MEEGPSAKNNLIWQIVTVAAALATIIGVFTPFVIDYASKSRKELTVYLYDPVSIVKQEGILQSVKILFNDTPLDSIFVQTIKYENSGNTAISKSDIQSNVKLIFEKSKIIDVKIRDRSPTYIDGLVHFSDGSVEIEHTLMNSGDSFTIDIISTGQIPTLSSCSLRIVGVKNCQIRNIRSKEENYTILFDVPYPTKLALITISVVVVGLIALALIFYLTKSLLDLFRFSRALAQPGDLNRMLSVFNLQREYDRLRNEPGIDNVDIAKKLLESINNKSATYVSSYIYKSPLDGAKQEDVEEYVRKELIVARERTLPRYELAMYLVTLAICFIVLSVVGGPARTMFEPFLSK